MLATTCYIPRMATLGFKIKRIDHVAVCAEDGAGMARRLEELLGLVVTHRENVPSQHADAVRLAVGAGETAIELVSPRGNEGLERFLAKRGPGLHHVAIEVEGLAAALAALQALGVPLVDQAPRAGAGGHQVAFLHPKATGGLLVELVEPRRA